MVSKGGGEGVAIRPHHVQDHFTGCPFLAVSFSHPARLVSSVPCVCPFLYFEPWRFWVFCLFGFGSFFFLVATEK